MPGRYAKKHFLRFCVFSSCLSCGIVLIRALRLPRLAQWVDHRVRSHDSTAAIARQPVVSSSAGAPCAVACWRCTGGRNPGKRPRCGGAPRTTSKRSLGLRGANHRSSYVCKRAKREPARHLTEYLMAEGRAGFYIDAHPRLPECRSSWIGGLVNEPARGETANMVIGRQRFGHDNRLRPVFITVRHVREGEELTVNYGRAYTRAYIAGRAPIKPAWLVMRRPAAALLCFASLPFFFFYSLAHSTLLLFHCSSAISFVRLSPHPPHPSCSR
jgi:hypothetical protein